MCVVGNNKYRLATLSVRISFSAVANGHTRRSVILHVVDRCAM